MKEPIACSPGTVFYRLKAIINNMVWLGEFMMDLNRSCKALHDILGKYTVMDIPAVYNVPVKDLTTHVAALAESAKALSIAIEGGIYDELQTSISFGKHEYSKITSTYDLNLRRLDTSAAQLEKQREVATHAINEYNAFRRENPTITEADKKVIKRLSTLAKNVQVSKTQFHSALESTKLLVEGNHFHVKDFLKRTAPLDREMAIKFQLSSFGLVNALTGFTTKYSEAAGKIASTLLSFDLEGAMRGFMEEATQLAHSMNLSSDLPHMEDVPQILLAKGRTHGHLHGENGSRHAEIDVPAPHIVDPEENDAYETVETGDKGEGVDEQLQENEIISLPMDPPTSVVATGIPPAEPLTAGGAKE